MRLIIITVLLATAIATSVPSLGRSVNNIKWTDCDSTGQPYLELLGFTVTSELKSGSSLSVDIQGNNKQTFTIFGLTVQMYINGIRVYSNTYKLTDPQHLNKGPGQINFTRVLPVGPPGGNYKTIAIIRDQSGNELQCFLVTFTIA